MRDDEIGALIQRSLDRHVDDVEPAPDLGEWVIERGRVVRRRRRATAVAGGVATLAVVAGAAILVPRLGAQQDHMVPAGSPSSVVRTTAPHQTVPTTAGPSPSAVPVHPGGNVVVTSTPTVTVTSTVTATSTPTGTSTETETPAPIITITDTAPADPGSTYTEDVPTTPVTEPPAPPEPQGPSAPAPQEKAPAPVATTS